MARKPPRTAGAGDQRRWAGALSGRKDDFGFAIARIRRQYLLRPASTARPVAGGGGRSGGGVRDRCARNGAAAGRRGGAADVAAMQATAQKVRVDESLLDYALGIVERTRQSEHLSLGISPRGSVMLHRAAQALAFVEGRDYCLPDDFKRLIVPVFAHRLVVSTRYASTAKKMDQAETILNDILESTAVPM